MKICIYGAGAMGGYIGVLLARSGVDVSLVARGPHLAALRQDGARLLIGGEELRVRPPCTDDPRELGPQDYVFVTLKAHSLPGAVAAMLPLLGPETAVVTASNGLPYWYFAGLDGPLHGEALTSIDPGGRQARLLGPQRGIGCVPYPAAELVAPGVIKHVHGNKFPIGEPDGETTPRLRRLHEAMQAAGLEAPMRADIRDEIWLKLWGNLCFSPIAALTHATLDVIAGDPGTRALCRTMMAEAKAVSDRLGIRLRVDAERRIDGAGAVGAHKVSMLVDLEQGRPMEIEALVGVVQELGRRLDVATPSIDVVLALIRLRQRTATGASVKPRVETV